MTTSKPHTEPFWLGYVLDALLARHCEATTYTKLSIQRRGGMYGRVFHRMQVLKSSNSMLSTMYRFGLRDGIPSLWGGLSASILRQGTYSTARFGLHNYLSSRLLHTSGRDRLPASWNIACAGVSGGIAGLIGNPTEIVLVHVSQIASYASAKQSLLASSNMSDNVTTHVLASLMAGTVATTLCAPADVLKSRMQSSASGDASSFLFGHCS
ncbi:mitochondrial dicarboxylate carrier, putative [Metarhizium acridum CQMa 102]|uniref:Mitochondrial dicarboxylate carrier, putative n=1 Tax=Metarhizium acridum (strain CQMa 102) TaxID=655827 RepID=E9EDG0_METAQ|nr:mitochondrial dicarboxylate carrier, putative [Metarhizium acridum CQMa 102]EFY86024.1 mitochondrial dicarboxylate carrier, putative [Metarhizium acridum CQMa 102]